MNPRALVTVVLPVRDEQETVGLALDSLGLQTVGPESLEVMVYDGGSTDRTAQVAEGYRSRYSWGRFAVADNPGRTVPHALNAALREASAPWFMRLDGRTRLSPQYIEVCLAMLRQYDELVAVGGRLRAEASGRVAEAIAAAVTHPLGVGIGFRTAERRVEIPHHPFAIWRREDARALGGFNVSLTRNQDDEFSMRARERGARIFLEPAGEVVYRPRERLRGLAAQYFQYGLWKSAVARRHGLFPARSLVPAAAAGAALLVAALIPRTHVPAGAAAVSYLVMGAVASKPRQRADPVTTGAALAVLHLSYGIGVLVGAVRPELTGGRLGSARIR